MIIPPVSARVEKRYHLIRGWVDACKVRSFSQVASVASQSQVGKLITPAVLLGDNMLHMMGKATVLLSKQAVFAAAVGPAPD